MFLMTEPLDELLVDGFGAGCQTLERRVSTVDAGDPTSRAANVGWLCALANSNPDDSWIRGRDGRAWPVRQTVANLIEILGHNDGDEAAHDRLRRFREAAEMGTSWWLNEPGADRDDWLKD